MMARRKTIDHNLLLPHQQDFLRLGEGIGVHGYDAAGWLKARQIGGTTINRWLAVDLASRGRDVTVFSVTKEETLDFTDRVVDLLEKRYPRRQFSRTRIKVPGGGIIRPKAANERTARGPSGHIILDEVDYYWDPEKLLDEALAIATQDGCRVYLTTTPYHEGSFVHRLLSDPKYARGIRWMKTDIRQAIKSGLPADLARLHRLFPDEEVFAARYLCLFMSAAGLWFNLDLVKNSSEHWLRPKRARRYGGIDASRGRDKMVLFTILEDERGRLYAMPPQPDEIIQSKSTGVIRKKVTKWVAEGDFTAVGVDASEPSYYLFEHLNDRFPGKIVELHPNQANQTRWAGRARAAIDERDLVLYSDRLFLDDFRKVRKTPDGFVKTVRDDQGHADTVWAMIHAFEAATRGVGAIVNSRGVAFRPVEPNRSPKKRKRPHSLGFKP